MRQAHESKAAIDAMVAILMTQFPSFDEVMLHLAILLATIAVLENWKSMTNSEGQPPASCTIDGDMAGWLKGTALIIKVYITYF